MSLSNVAKFRTMKLSVSSDAFTGGLQLGFAAQSARLQREVKALASRGLQLQRLFFFFAASTGAIQKALACPENSLIVNNQCN